MKKLCTLIVVLTIMSLTGCGGSGGGVDPDLLAQALGDAASSLASGYFDEANTHFEEAMNIDPSNANANIGWAITELALEIDNVILFIDPDAETLFRRIGSVIPPLSFAYDLPGKFGGVTSAVFGFTNHVARSADDTEKNADQLQDEMERFKPILESIVNSLKKGQVILKNASNRDEWYVRIPKDVNYIPAGYYKFDYADLLILIGGLDMARGLGDFFISLNVTGIEDFANIDWYYPEDMDTNDDGILVPAEYFPSGQAMTLRSGYGSTMSNVDNLLRQGAEYIEDGIVATLAETADDEELLPVNTDLELRAEIEGAFTYKDDFFASLTNAGVELNLNDLDEYADPIMFRFSLKRLFDPAIEDWRDIAPIMYIDTEYGAYLPEDINDSLDDITMHGIFSAGISNDLWQYIVGNFSPG